MKKITISILSAVLFMLPQLHYAQAEASADTAAICVNKDEIRLLNLINELRIAEGKQKIPLSASLTKVAKMHTHDLETNHPDTSVCNYHSWSDKGEWTACCYNPYDVRTECIRNKPGELTGYNYPGFELITWDSRKAHPDSVFNLWNSFDASRNMFLNNGDWKRISWKAIGLSISDHYVSIWFGERADREKEPMPCNGDTATSISDSNTRVTSKESSEYLSPGGEYHIIYGSYTEANDAIKVKQELINQFPDIGIIKGEDNYRISLDRFPDMQEARKAKESYDSRFKDSWLLKY